MLLRVSSLFGVCWGFSFSRLEWLVDLELGAWLCLAMLDTQEGMMEMIKLWKKWQEVQYSLDKRRKGKTES